jgi:sigma-70-like protein
MGSDAGRVGTEPGSRAWFGSMVQLFMPILFAEQDAKSPTTSSATCGCERGDHKTATTLALGGVLPWLIGIARNSLRAHFRLRVNTLGQRLASRCDPWADADDRLDAGRLATALERALGALSEEHREILLLVAWEQLSPAEIAHALQMPPGTVRSRLHRARSALREYLRAELELRPESDPQEVCG